MFAPTFKASSATPGKVANETEKFEKKKKNTCNVIFLRTGYKFAITKNYAITLTLCLSCIFFFFSDVHACGFNYSTTIIHHVNIIYENEE